MTCLSSPEMILDDWPVSLVTGPGGSLQASVCSTRFGRTPFLLFLGSTGLQSLLRVHTTHSDSDAFSPFAQNEHEVVSQTRSSTSHTVQVGMGPHWGDLAPKTSGPGSQLGKDFCPPK